MAYFGTLYLDKEKDIVIELSMRGDVLFYTLKTPNHRTGNLITNLARLCDLPITEDRRGLKIIRGTVPSYVDVEDKLVYILRLGGTKIANIYPDGTIARKAQVPAIAKTLMSQTKDYNLSIFQTLVKTYIKSENKFHADLHTHMNANLPPDVLIALGIMHEIRYPLYYIKKLNLKTTKTQWSGLMTRRKKAEENFGDTELTGRYRTRRIDDMTFINFADLILNNKNDAAENIAKIRASLAVLKDGQAVFSSLEKVYLYRYVFTRGVSCEKHMPAERLARGIAKIPDADVRETCMQILADRKRRIYRRNTIFEDKLLWIARQYASKGIYYAEISDTSLVRADRAPEVLSAAHRLLPQVYKETGVLLRFLGALRRIPLTIVKDKAKEREDYAENLRVLSAIAADPYVAGADIVGEEINDIRKLAPVIQRLVAIAAKEPDFVIRIHAGENDSLLDNVQNSIRCVKDGLAKGQKMPQVRIGHGLYTANLKSAKGRQLLREIKQSGATLEFQITSNVRLNNLSNLASHPLKAYLRAGVRCVQGTDGGALYGTDSLDEQLSLERMLGLFDAEFLQMKRAEERVVGRGMAAFQRKEAAFVKTSKRRGVRGTLEDRLAKEKRDESLLMDASETLPAEEALQNQIRALPKDKLPLVIAGGSFGSERGGMRTEAAAAGLISKLLDSLDPEKVFFMVGHRLQGYEKKLVEENAGRFEIFAMVPSRLSPAEIRRLQRSGLAIRVALEPVALGTYKSFSYEVFQRRRSVLIAFGGNIACMNLIQEARIGRGKSAIFLYEKSRMIKQKATSLKGYVTLFRSSRILGEVLTRVEEQLNKKEVWEEDA